MALLAMIPMGASSCTGSRLPTYAGTGGLSGAGTGGRTGGGTGGGTSPDASVRDSGPDTGGGTGGVGGSAGSSDGSTDSAPITTAPWPETCVPAASLSRPASEYLLTGPAGSSGFGQAALPGETMTATLNGFARSFGRFETDATGVVGYGFDGSIRISLPSLAPGTYSCPDVLISYANQNAGGRDSNSAITRDCCAVQVIRSGGIGESIEGSFSGILVHQSLQSWIKVESGHFTITRRGGGTDAGTATGTDGG